MSSYILGKRPDGCSEGPISYRNLSGDSPSQHLAGDVKFRAQSNRVIDEGVRLLGEPFQKRLWLVFVPPKYRCAKLQSRSPEDTVLRVSLEDFRIEVTEVRNSERAWRKRDLLQGGLIVTVASRFDCDRLECPVAQIPFDLQRDSRLSRSITVVAGASFSRRVLRGGVRRHCSSQRDPACVERVVRRKRPCSRQCC